MAVVLRGYRRRDLEALWRLDEACFAGEFRFDQATMRRFVERRGAIVVVAEDEASKEYEGVCGFAIVHLEAGRPAFQQSSGYVVTLDVAEAWRRRGLAACLMEEAERQVAATGATWMRLHVFVENVAAIAFYERAGYERGERMEEFYGEGLDAWVFRRRLFQEAILGS